MTVQIEVHSNHPAAGQSVRARRRKPRRRRRRRLRVVRLYFSPTIPGVEAVARLCNLLLADPVTESWAVARAEGETGDRERGRFCKSLNLKSPKYPNLRFSAPRDRSRLPPRRDQRPRPRVADRGIVENRPAGVRSGDRRALRTRRRPHARRLRGLEPRQLLCNTTVQHFAIGEITVHFGERPPPATASKQSHSAGWTRRLCWP